MDELAGKRKVRADEGYKGIQRDLKNETGAIEDITISDKDIKKLLKGKDPDIEAMRKKLKDRGITINR